MKNPLIFLLFVAVLSYGCKSRKVGQQANAYPEERLGWKLGSQAYTFNRFDFFQAIAKIDSCKLRYVEAFPGQRIGGGLEGRMDYHMPAERRQQILARLKDSGVTLYGYGVVTPRSADEWKQLFEFAKAMGIRTITSEPPVADLDMIAGLCNTYKINVALHNHPKPSIYWDVDFALQSIGTKSRYLGLCADIGHWVRSGLDPVACMKKARGRVLHMHFKDLNEKSARAHDVHWGSGVSNIPAVLTELKEQRFKGMISAEYEYNWKNNAPDVAASVAFFRSAL
ncbi:sugar phosphate isomerase/epimerase [Pedobacter sp. SYP-B3415]|uniref:sugar phosphate isomerase/epimerase family protein n=1 Tax=Pedobacter sp. SYP-B3415 TaxID=2496641 RepID=UPI00101D7F04|nr:sugar phosphate isomerase/epimerase [Pedobacter sp. SYP-B3415]